MRAFQCILVLVLLSSTAFSQQAAGTNFSKKKIVFVAGPDSHGKGEHEHFGGSTLLAKALNDHVPEAQAVVVQNGWPMDEAILNDAAAIVIYADGGGSHLAIEHAAALDKLVKKGIGLVQLHFALEVPQGEAGNYFLNWIGGYFEINWSVNPVWEASFASFPDHPISRGVKPFSITDEWYYHLRFTKDSTRIIPILKALPPESTLDKPDGTHSNNPAVRESVISKKEVQTLAWAYTRPEGGRSFGFTGGHIHKNWADNNFRKVVLNAIAWTAQIEVPQEGIKSTTPTEAELNGLTKQGR